MLLSSTLISVVPFNARGSSDIRNELSNSSSATTPEAEPQSKSQQKGSEIRQERSGHSQSKEVTTPVNKEQKKKNNPPNANAGLDVTVNENQEMTLNADKSNDAEGDELSFLWTQISPRKPKVDLKDSGSDRAQFIAPQVDTKSLVLTFSVTVHDSNGAKGIDTVRVKVNNLVEQQNDQIVERPQTNPDKHSNLKELAEQATKNAQSERQLPNDPKPSDNPNGVSSTSERNKEGETAEDPRNTKQELVQANAIPPGSYGFTVSRVDGKHPTGDPRILDVDLSYSGKVVVTGDTWNFGPVSGSCTITY